MKELGIGRIEECLSLARANIIRARITRQMAGIVAEFDRLYGSDYVENESSDDLYEMAKHYRGLVRKDLKAAEIENGKRFLTGEATSALKLALNGFKFREWGEYAHQYKYCRLFCGVDPE